MSIDLPTLAKFMADKHIQPPADAKDWDRVFAELVQAGRDIVKEVEAMPADQVDEPLAKFRDDLRAALDQYDRSQSANSDDDLWVNHCGFTK
jgi:hypothetical protein